MILLSHKSCPTCGAPLSVDEGQSVVICSYCDSSLRVIPSVTSASTVELQHDEVPAEVVEQVKQLVLDGKTDEAVTHYVNAAGISRPEAEKAVDQLVLMDIFQLTRRAPLHPIAVLIVLMIVLACAGGLAWAAMRAAEAPAYAIVAIFPALVAFWLVRTTGAAIVSAFIARFGSEGQARIVQRKVLRPKFVRGGVLVLLLFEVTPTRGGPTFLDQEVMSVRQESVAKLEPGNVVHVRYGRGRVFPTSPITVLEPAAAA